MSDQIDLTTIIFALVAVFIVWKMRAVLGTRNESHPNSASRNQNGSIGSDAEASATNLDRNVPDLRWKPFATFGTEMWQRLEEISKIDPTFDPREFIEGAKIAYDLILKAFSAGDADALRPLLGKEVLDSFAAAITDRVNKGARLETTLVSLDRAEMKEIKITGSVAQIVMRFASKVITITTDQKGLVLEGAADRVEDVVDVWTFQRDLNTSDPNWKLVSTEEPH